jgi:TolA-binding protein
MGVKGKLVLAACGALLVGALVARPRPHGQPVGAAPSDPAGETHAEEEPRPPDPAPTSTTAPLPQPARRPPPAPPPPAVSEPALMSAIRELGAADPARALELAREGNRRFPNSGDAAERTWTICKSLAALGRFSEAQQEARRMVQQYPDTTWASDVKRHLLTQPLEDPGQRGYGKSSELD